MSEIMSFTEGRLQTGVKSHTTVTDYHTYHSKCLPRVLTQGVKSKLDQHPAKTAWLETLYGY